MIPNAQEQVVYQISRPVMRAQSIQVLQDILDSNNVEDILQAFEKREKEGIIKNKKKPEAFKKYLQKLRGRIKEWSPEETRNIINDMSREFVTKNIIECDHKSEPKEWHRNIKMFSNYKAQSSILNLTNGPIAEIGEW